jgi:epimerase transport system membrane fusion protein
MSVNDGAVTIVKNASETSSETLNSVLYEIRFYRRLGYVAALVMFLGFLLWAAFVPLKSAIVANGKVVASELNKVVQSPSTGVVANLAVREGDLVTKDQVLLQLSDIQLRAQFDIVNERWLNALVNLDRLRSERDSSEQIRWSDSVTGLTQQSVQDHRLMQENLFKARRQSFKDEQAIYKNRIEQTRLQISALSNLLTAQKKRLNSIEQDYQDWIKLYEKRFTDKVKVRDLQRNISDLSGEIAAKQAEKSRLEQMVLETQQLASQRTEEYMKEVAEQIRNYQSQFIEAKHQMDSYQDALDRLSIKATGSGRVVGLKLTTVGAVVESNRLLMEIVPEGQNFKIKTKIKPSDIDQVYIGQEAEVKFTAFRLNFMPVLYGRVIAVGADALTDENDRLPYYSVAVEVTAEAVQSLEERGWALVAGMPADVYLKTRDRNLLSYILRPFTLLISNAFNDDDGL